MADDIKIKIGRKAEEKPKKLAKSEKAGPIEEGEVEGQSSWIIMQCPWCGGMNRCWDTPALDVWTCAWCGNLFY